MRCRLWRGRSERRRLLLELTESVNALAGLEHNDLSAVAGSVGELAGLLVVRFERMENQMSELSGDVAALTGAVGELGVSVRSAVDRVHEELADLEEKIEQGTATAADLQGIRDATAAIVGSADALDDLATAPAPAPGAETETPASVEPDGVAPLTSTETASAGEVPSDTPAGGDSSSGGEGEVVP